MRHPAWQIVDNIEYNQEQWQGVRYAIPPQCTEGILILQSQSRHGSASKPVEMKAIFGA